MSKSKKPKSVSKAASVLASDDSSADAKSLAGSVLATSDDEAVTESEPTAFEAEAAIEVEEGPMVRFQDEPYIEVEPGEIVGEYSPDLADSETLDEFPDIVVTEVEEAVAPVSPKDDQFAQLVEAQGHVAVQPNVNRD